MPALLENARTRRNEEEKDQIITFQTAKNLHSHASFNIETMCFDFYVSCKERRTQPMSNN